MKASFNKFDHLEASDIKVAYPYFVGANLLVTFGAASASDSDFNYCLYDLEDKVFVKGEHFTSLESAKMDALKHLKQ